MPAKRKKTDDDGYTPFVLIARGRRSISYHLHYAFDARSPSRPRREAVERDAGKAHGTLPGPDGAPLESRARGNLNAEGIKHD